jgi:phosphoenolpyruvate carboxylase
LRRDVRLLGDLLGNVIADYGGRRLLSDVEALRRLVILARTDDRFEGDAERLVASWSLQRAEEVARAFTVYFHLANLAEEHHRARVLRERDTGAEPLPESLPATVMALRSRLGKRRLSELLSEFELHPVFTAHPTEARRRAVVTAIRRAGDQLERIDDRTLGAGERQDAERRLAEEVDSLWRTAQLRSTPVHPLDEVRSVMAVFDETLFRVTPEVYRGLDRALGPADWGRRAPLAAPFLRFGSWVGGDRDGNPTVTAAITAAALEVQADHTLSALETVAARVGRAMTVDEATTPASPGLRRRLTTMMRVNREGSGEIVRRAPGEPHRQFLLHVAARIRSTRGGDARRGYRNAQELLGDLGVAQRSLAAAGAHRLAFGELQHLMWQVQTFGFHGAELEVRQHSAVHAQALEQIRARGAQSPATREVLDTLRAMAKLQKRFGPDACRRYVVSFTRGAADIAAVHELTRHAVGRAPLLLDVIPLFETLDDLSRAASTMQSIFELPEVRRRLKANGRRIEVMLGYSDSAKEAGPLSATLALHEAQAALASWAKRRRLKLTIFHGRGGALGRGGGPANRAVRAQAPGSVAGRFKVTEQGEVIFARYGNRAIARRHLEQVASAVLEASAPIARRAPSGLHKRFEALARTIDARSRVAYRALLDAPGFEAWFAKVSPVEELGRLRIGSRPARRSSNRGLEDLRAIPWVFAWSQMRLNLPGWYGLGSGLSAAPLDALRRAYRSWPLFNVLLDNAEMSLAKTDRRIAQRYLALGDRPELSDRVLREYDLTMDRVLAVTGHRRLLEDRRVLSWAIELRNPYVDALSHLQLLALRSLRSEAENRDHNESAERLFQLTVNGVAAGLQNTG